MAFPFLKMMAFPVKKKLENSNCLFIQRYFFIQLLELSKIYLLFHEQYILKNHGWQ